MNIRTFLPILIAVSAFLCQGISYAGEVPASDELSFGAFCTKVVNYYPKLARGGETVEIAIARKWQAYAGYLPHIYGNASMTTSDDQVYVFGTLLRQKSFTNSDFLLSNLNDPASRTNYNIGIYGEMPIFDAMQTIYKVRSSKFMLESAKHDQAFVKMEALLVATDAYLHSLSLRDMLKIAEEALTDSENDVKQAEDLKSKGMILGADYYAAKVMFGNIKSARNELLEEKKRMDALLNILMGEDPLKPVELAGDLKDNGKSLDKALDAWLVDAYASREDLRSIESAMSSRQAELSREKSTILPRISGFGNLQENTQNFVKGGGTFTVGLRGDIDLFDPTYSGRVKEAKAALKSLEYEKMILADSVKKDVTEEYSRYQTIVANMPVVREMAGDSKEAVSLTLPLYREGRKSIADLLEMRQAYLYTNKTYYNILAGSGSSKARLLFVSGSLDRQKAEEIMVGGN
jgi:outer membrane protein TolC